MPKGLIVSNISNLYEVKTENEIVECKPMGKMKQDEITPVVGDYVEIEVIENEQNKGRITKVLDRTMYSKRPKLANLTQIILVLSLKSPKPDFLLLDKQLAYAEYLKIKPIICINKIDLKNEKLLAEIHEVYEKIGYKVINTIAKKGDGIDKLKQILKNNITAFSGNSGVGKSTLINAIFEDGMTQEGEISQRNKRGKNTTTSTKIYEINNNTYIADTPGFSTFSIEEIESKNLAIYFKELKNEIGNCEFVGCTHIKEEICGIKEAIKEGKISIERYDRFCKIYQELKQREERKKW